MTADRLCNLLGIALLLAAASSGAQSRVYRWVDANGVVHFSDSAPADSANPAATETIVSPDSRPAAPAPAPVRVRANREEPAAPTQDANVPSLPSPTAAPDCIAPSPHITTGRELYEFSDDFGPPLTPQQLKSFATATKEMEGRWTGTDVGVSCDGRRGRPPSRAAVAEGRAATAERFRLESTISSQGNSRRDLLDIQVRNGRLWVNGGGAALISVSNRALEFGYIQQLGGTVTELYWRIQVDGRREMSVEHVLSMLRANCSRRALGD